MRPLYATLLPLLCVLRNPRHLTRPSTPLVGTTQPSTVRVGIMQLSTCSLLVGTTQPSTSFPFSFRVLFCPFLYFSCGYYATLYIFLWVLRNPLRIFLWVLRNPLRIFLWVLRNPLYIFLWVLRNPLYFFFLWVLRNPLYIVLLVGTMQPSIYNFLWVLRNPLLLHYLWVLRDPLHFFLGSMRPLFIVLWYYATLYAFRASYSSSTLLVGTLLVRPFRHYTTLFMSPFGYCVTPLRFLGAP
jgi:hypothetical protein